MKHNWEYKRLGDICDLYQPKTIAASELVEDGEYDVYGANGIIGKFTRYNHEFPEILLTCRGATCGTINISNPKSWINGNAMVIHSKSSELSFAYLKYAMTALDYSNIITGAAQPQITRQSLAPTNIPLPPMEVQEQIVAELDKINETIEDCRELLRNLDALAQSLFYDFFGDPITNPKGWPLYKLSSISQLINGRAYKQNELLDEGKYKVIRVGNFFTNSDYYYSDLELSPEKYIDYGDLIFAWSASFGAFIWQGDKVIYHYHIWKILFDDNLLNKIFYKFLLNEMTSSFMKDLHGIGMMHLTKAGMENYMLPVPPLSLQEQFADRIEQIEAQKKVLENTIAELQTLLDSRMDYWFN